MSNIRKLLVASLLLLTPFLSQAENGSTDLGDYIVHYSAFSADILPPQVAKTYGIRRSSNTGMINITVLKKDMGTPGQPVNAEVDASATNLTGQYRKLDMRRLEQGPAIYYISTFRVADRETLDISVSVKPEGEDKARIVNFRQQFYTN